MANSDYSSEPRQSSDSQNARSAHIDALIDEVTRALKAVEPAAFLVLPRVLRRLIKHKHEIPGFGLKVPHRKSAVFRRKEVAEFVEPDEMGIDDLSELPNDLILLTRPDEHHLADITAQELMGRSWQLLFHARIHLAFDALQLTQGEIRERIDRLGQVEYDEIHAVLKQERFIFPDSKLIDVYVEFAAVYCEYRKFAPNWLRVYFPSLTNLEHVDDLLRSDVDFESLYDQTRLYGAPDPVIERSVTLDRVSAVQSLSDAVAARSNPRWRKYHKLTRRAERASGRGNDAGAAIHYVQAARFAPPQEVEATRDKALAAIERLVNRLRDALRFNDLAAEDWRDAMAGLASHSLTGFWNADKRLLYDLQRVCVDHERDIYTVDLLEWLRSFGKRPVKRSLPNQREVLMAKHLHRASKRLASAKLPGGIRTRLSELLHEAAETAEQQLRERLRPLIHEALEAVRLQPNNLPERVSFSKLVEELLDCVVQRGFLTMGYFRDAISRNNIKMEDLSVAAECDSIPFPRRAGGFKGTLAFCAGVVDWLLTYFWWSVREFWWGDKLLKADRKFNVLLDGVYHSGESYLRGLQRLSLLGFGTQTGRFLTKFVTIPFGGAYVALEGVAHIVGGIMGHEHGDTASHDGFNPTMLVEWPIVVAVGFFLMGLFHSAPFRDCVVGVLKYTYRFIRYVLFDFPNWLSHIQAVRRIWRSRPMRLFRRFILNPALITFLICVVVPMASGQDIYAAWLMVTVFLALNLVLNSRTGRDAEEVTVEWVGAMWHRFTVGVIVGVFELIMSAFKRFLETFDRVLYAVDEWLRFKSGESSITLGVKAVLGIFWSVFTYVARFCVNLLIEPQVNPIKHFPVVTVSHKILLPLAVPPGSGDPSPLGSVLLALRLTSDVSLANTISGTVVWLIPGIFGFLVWELTSNWKLYRANRSDRLRPVLVGDHGETMSRLMKPGFHSGTLPKLFNKLRRAQRKAHLNPSKDTTSKYREHQHHIEISIRHFVERELLQLLDESQLWGEREVLVQDVSVASNTIVVHLLCPDVTNEPMAIAFQEQSGWLVASVIKAGWSGKISSQARSVLSTAIAGFYQISGVDLVREQVEDCFNGKLPSYDVMESGLAVWPTDDYSVEVIYILNRKSHIRVSPKSVARDYQMPIPEPSELLFSETSVAWSRWVQIWESERSQEQLPDPYDAPIRVLPHLAEHIHPSEPIAADASATS